MSMAPRKPAQKEAPPTIPMNPPDPPESPHSIEIEKALLASLIMDPDRLSVIQAILKEGDFFRIGHQIIFGTMVKLAGERSGFDVPLLIDEITLSGNLGRMGGETYIRDILSSGGGPVRATEYAWKLHELSAQRGMLEAHQQGINEILLRCKNVDELVALNRGRFDAITNRLSRASSGNSQSQYDGITNEDMGILRASSLQPEPTTWNWEKKIPKGKFGILAGEGSDGKSTVATAIVASLTAGLLMPDWTVPNVRGRCIILAAEDGLKDTIMPRLMAAGADPELVDIVTCKVSTTLKDGTKAVNLMSFQDREYWAELLRRLPDTVMIVADPIPAHLGRGINDNHNAEVRSVMEPFLAMLDEAGVSLLGISHTGKSADMKTPLHKILGSVAYSNLARVAFVTTRHPDDPERRLLFQPKNNLAPTDGKAIAYRIVQAEVIRADGQVVPTSKAVFESEPVSLSAAECMEANRNPSKKRGRPPERSIEAASWLFDYLKAEAQPTPLGAILKAGGTAGFAGTQKNDGKWSNPMLLFRCVEFFGDLEPPRDGHMVEEMLVPMGKSGKMVKHWALSVRLGDDGANPTHKPPKPTSDGKPDDPFLLTVRG